MIDRIILKNFKCFEHLILPLSPLTLLTGFNAGGKSSAVQGLLILSQTLRRCITFDSLAINGDLVALGSPGDVLYNRAEKNEIVIGIECNGIIFENVLGIKKSHYENALTMESFSFVKSGKTIENKFSVEKGFKLIHGTDNQDTQNIVNLISNIVYISAIRKKHIDIYSSPDSPWHVHADVGVNGEYAPWWFYQLIDENIDINRCHSNEKAMTLRRQFNAWANDLFPGAEANSQRIENTNLLKLELRISELENWRRPANIGYGLTYAFPVLVAGLLAKRNQVLIIDSPEAHLHPMGQSKMGRFLAKMAAAGVQIIIETHSDHILNGIRLALRDKLIGPGDISVHFFKFPEANRSNSNVLITSPQVDQFGNLSEWPEGFFDQSENDLAKLAGWE